MDDDIFEGRSEGATILSFPDLRKADEDSAELKRDLGVAATNMAAMQATVINMLCQQVNELHRLLPRVVDGLMRRPESALIAKHWDEAAEGQEHFLFTIVDILSKAAVGNIDADLMSSTERSALRLQSLVAECRRPPDERAVLFGSASYLKKRVAEETEILRRALLALDAAARKAAGLD